jgi:DNA invertase Pin-like site-specific DNA recombinase
MLTLFACRRSSEASSFFLAMVGAFSQFYSDNLSQETKKGWAERRAQGLYCGLLPFGAMKGEEGVTQLKTLADSDFSFNPQALALTRQDAGRVAGWRTPT